MRKYALVSPHTRKKYSPHSVSSNEAPVPHLLNRNFNDHAPGTFVVSDLTYVKVGDRWSYICLLLDLVAREIIGYSVGNHKDAKLVHKAFSTVQGNLLNIQVFHTDRGREYDNRLIDDLLNSFQIQRSLIMKGCPYDNAVAESTFRSIKAELVNHRHFLTVAQLQAELADYVH